MIGLQRTEIGVILAALFTVLVAETILVSITLHVTFPWSDPDRFD